MKWQSGTLGGICDAVGGTIRTGPFGSQLHESDYEANGIPVVMPKDIIDGQLSTASIARTGDTTADRLSAHRLKAGDIVYGRRGDIGRRALVRSDEEGWLCGTGCLRISLGDKVLDPRWLYYYLGTPDVVADIANQAIGATMPNLNTSILRGVKVYYPSLPTQRRIADILSAYDDLIENNTRRMAILEEMARSLYGEWFVNFRFPEHEDVELVESPLGLVPKMWTCAPLSQVADVNRNSVRPQDAPALISYVDIASVEPGRVVSVLQLPFNEAPGRARRQVQHGDVIWSNVRPNRRSYSLILNPAPNLIVSTGFTVLSSKAVPFSYLYQSVTTDNFVGYLTNHATGAAYPAVKASDFESAQILLPSDWLTQRYHSIAEPMLVQCATLHLKNDVLRKTRDLLLPKLISGELSLEALDEELVAASV